VIEADEVAVRHHVNVGDILETVRDGETVLVASNVGVKEEVSVGDAVREGVTPERVAVSLSVAVAVGNSGDRDADPESVCDTVSLAVGSTVLVLVLVGGFVAVSVANGETVDVALGLKADGLLLPVRSHESVTVAPRPESVFEKVKVCV
jgi:hypothetical protein